MAVFVYMTQLAYWGPRIFYTLSQAEINPSVQIRGLNLWEDSSFVKISVVILVGQ